jgi:peroxiredoxin
MGDASIVADHGSVRYRFATIAHRDAFVANPHKYEPAYGGWCAWAIKDGDKVEVDPKKFIVKDGRLYLFYNGFWGDTKAKWEKLDHAQQVRQGDALWKKLSGEEPPAATSLQSKLDAIKASFAASAPAELQATFAEGIKDVGDSGVVARAKKVGEQAPRFSLPDASGKPVSLDELLKAGPVVITWYRGGWCPYCNVQLKTSQDALQEVGDLRAQLVAISPQTPDNSLSTQEKNELTFPVLSDEGNRVASAWGLTYTLPAKVQQAFEGRLDLKKFNGGDGTLLPLAATFVVAQDGTIAYAFVDADYTKRAEVGEIVAALKALAK